MFNGNSAVEVIKRKFEKNDRPVKIPLQTGRPFKASRTDEGILVDNLGRQPLLSWMVFEEAVKLLGRNGGRAARGDAMRSKLGEAGLSLTSVEGHIAHVVYYKQAGDSVFRRISPVADILVWAGVCDNAPGELILR